MLHNVAQITLMLWFASDVTAVPALCGATGSH